MKTLLLGVTFLFSSVALAQGQQGIELLLNARGLQAMDKIESTLKKNPKQKYVSKKDQCELLPEYAYINFINPKTSKMVKRDLGDGFKSYVFLILDQDSKVGFQMSYIYKGENDKDTNGIQISTIKVGWKITMSPEIEGHVFVTTPQSCTIGFNLKDPLDVAAKELDL